MVFLLNLGILDWLSNPIGSAIGAIGGAITNAQNAKENQKNREWNEKMWHMTNEYNSPVAQLARWQDAGISVNPNYLVTGGGNSLASYTGNLDASRSMENPLKGFNPGFIEARKIQNETELKDSQKEVNDSAIVKNASETRKLDSDASNAAAQAEKTRLDSQLLRSNMQTLIEDAKEALEMKRKANKISDKEYEIRSEQLRQQAEIFRRLQAEANTAEEETRTQQKQTGLIGAKILTEKTQQELNRALKGQAISQTALNEATKKLQDELVKNQSLIRENLAEEKNKLIADTYKVFVDAGVSENTAKKLAEETNQMIMNGKVERWAKTIRDKYGSGVVGNILGVYYQSTHAKDVRIEGYDYTPVTNHGATTEW